MQLYVGDYLKDTRHLTAEQHGAYLLLLMAMWTAGGELPNDPKKLARMAACSPSRWAKIGDDVLEFFTPDGDVIRNDRITKELKKASEKSIKRAVSGSKGGQAKALKAKGTDLANATVLLEHSSEPEPEEDTPLPPKGATRRKPETSLPVDCPKADLVAEMQAEAREVGANVDLAFEARQFRDWWMAKDGRQRDWDACWRTWARRSIAKAPRTAIASLAQRTAAPDDDRWRAKLREFQRNRFWPSDDIGPSPGRPGCRVPPHLLVEFGLTAQPANTNHKPDLFAPGAAA